jgi:phage baseplate assembly protein gpV
MAVDLEGGVFELNGVNYVALAPRVRGVGGTVSWDNEAKKASVSLGQQAIEVTMTDTNVVIDGNTVTLSAPPLVIDGTLVVPEEFFTSAIHKAG